MATQRKRPKPVEPERRKADEDRKDEIIRVRATAQQKGDLTHAADLKGQTLSQFLLGAGLTEARRVAKE